MCNEKKSEDIMKYIPYLQDRFEKEVDSRLKKNIEKSLEGKITFSGCAFLLGALYFFYRKCYIEGILIFILGNVLAFIVPYGGYIMPFISAVIFIPVYRRHIDRMIRRNCNPQKKGGTSLIAVIIVLLLEVLLLVVNFYFIN